MDFASLNFYIQIYLCRKESVMKRNGVKAQQAFKLQI